ncbi:MAG: SUMF1/EgtB/PvdO family nonheme iron enzyme [Nitrospiraceae bacterium]
MMSATRVGKLVTVNRVVNAIVAVVVALVIANIAWGLDTQDVTMEWTEAGKKVAAERVATWKPKDDMVLVPAGEFVMGSDKKTDRLAYRGEIPQRRVYLDAFEIGKYEVTALEYQVRARHKPSATSGLAV